MLSRREMGIPPREELVKAAIETISKIPADEEINTRTLEDYLATRFNISESVRQERHARGNRNPVFRNAVDWVCVELGRRGVLINPRKARAPDSGQMTIYDRGKGVTQPGGQPASEAVAPSPRPLESARQVWLYAPGERARYWDEFRKAGVAALGWGDVGDLRPLSTREAVKARMDEVYADGESQVKALQCFDFAHRMQPGDWIFVKRGARSSASG
jgi:hypothetical protein